ncbi:MAG TPA: RDD family protein [Candidatus Dormibacteraeota bacterium]|nr:RDD family protein [Candidatus Dormibacteraeota bacterium]
MTTNDSVAVARPLTGAELRDAYAESLPALTVGMVRLRGNSVVAGPFELLRFGAPKVTSGAVEWPIAGGLLTRQAGGTWRLQASTGKAEATVSGYAPRLPRPIYSISHLHVHLLFTRLYLLRLRGREPAPGPRATMDDRARAASVDIALVLTVAGVGGRRRVARTLAIAIAYHVASWSITGRTLGGVVMRQRVVSVDGSRLTPTQSLLRVALLPVSWIIRRPVHDEIAGSEVIND